jgi:SDR family mycofactocin-dependent oxidoreductase
MPDGSGSTTARRVALVTGAGRGIGAATARRLAADGCAIVAVDRCADDPALGYPLSTRDELDAVVADCGAHAVAVEADVRDDAALAAAVQTAVERFGGLDIAVAAAGVMSGGQVAWKTSEEAWAANIDVNLSGVWRTAKATIGAMLRRPAPRRGRFIAIASAAGMSGHPTISAYCAAKHGVIGLVQSLAVELGTSGITANSVCPGSTASGILEASRQVYDLGSLDDFAVHHPIGRILQPEEIASGVSWLAAEAQSGVTGIALPVDGGMTI